jgi:hypothetical protein
MGLTHFIIMKGNEIYVRCDNYNRMDSSLVAYGMMDGAS